MKKEKKSFKGLIQVIKYTLCAASAGIIEAGSYALLIWLLGLIFKDGSGEVVFLRAKMSWVVLISQMVSLALSIVWNFTLNRKFTFQSNANVPLVLLLAFVFYIPFYPASTLFVGWFVPATTAALGTAWANTVGKGLSLLANFVLEFLWQKFFVFRCFEKKGSAKTDSDEGKADSADRTDAN